MSYTSSYAPRTEVARALYEEHMRPHGRTVCQVARLCDLPCQQIVDLLYGRTTVDVEIAVALADGLDTSAEFWLRLEEGNA